MLFIVVPSVGAQPPITTKPVQFKKGESGATIKGTIKGDQIVDYKVRTGAGQAMVVQFRPSNPSTYFNVLPPGSDEAIHVGSSAGNAFSAELKAGGEYTIRVYLMRNAARRNETTSYTLDIGIAGPVKQGSAPGLGVLTLVGLPGDGRQRSSDEAGLGVVGDPPRVRPDASVNGA
ncbi:MAG: hypothetical protein ACK5XG_17750 [Burkholderiales bacterium]